MPYKSYPSEDITLEEAERLIRLEHGQDIELTRKYYSTDRLMLWFIGEPDENFQNYIAQMGMAKLIIEDKTHASAGEGAE